MGMRPRYRRLRLGIAVITIAVLLGVGYVAHVTHVALVRDSFPYAILFLSDLSYRQYEGTRFDGPGSVEGKNLSHIRITYNIIANINAKHVNMRFADLSGATLYAWDFPDADLRDIRLENSGLAHCHFYHADLRGAMLRGATITDCYFYGTDLRDANLVGADLQGSHYDPSTLWPAGYDPRAHGAVLMTPKMPEWAQFRERALHTIFALLCFRQPRSVEPG